MINIYPEILAICLKLGINFHTVLELKINAFQVIAEAVVDGERTRKYFDVQTYPEKEGD